MATVFKQVINTFWSLPYWKVLQRTWMILLTITTITISLDFLLFRCLQIYQTHDHVDTKRVVVLQQSQQNETPKYCKSATSKTSMLVDHGTNVSNKNKAFLCGYTKGRMGNMMHMYASVFGVALIKNMTPSFCDSRNKIFTVFKHARAIPNHNRCQGNHRLIRNTYDVAYVHEDVAFSNDKNTSMLGYFQSWFYFKNSFSDIRHEFQFNDVIYNAASTAFNNALSTLRLDYDDVTYITVHVRRTDMLNDHYIKDGFLTPSARYYHKAMTWYRSRYNNKTAFIVCSEDTQWPRDNLALPDVVFITGNPGEVDMAVLSLGNHTIMSVGSFGWWGSFLAGGHTIAFATPARDGTRFRAQFSADLTDYFLPHWTILGDN